MMSKFLLSQTTAKALDNSILQMWNHHHQPRPPHPALLFFDFTTATGSYEPLGGTGQVGECPDPTPKQHLEKWLGLQETASPSKTSSAALQAEMD